MTAHLYYYAKAYFAAISAGVLYLATVIGPDITIADFAHISLLHWIGFIGSVLGVGVGTAAITNGSKPVEQNTDGSYPITNVQPIEVPATTFPKDAIDVAVQAADAAPVDPEAASAPKHSA